MRFNIIKVLLPTLATMALAAPNMNMDMDMNMNMEASKEMKDLPNGMNGIAFISFPHIFPMRSFLVFANAVMFREGNCGTSDHLCHAKRLQYVQLCSCHCKRGLHRHGDDQSGPECCPWLHDGRGSSGLWKPSHSMFLY